MRVNPYRWAAFGFVTLACVTLAVGATDPTRDTLPPTPPKLALPAHGVLFSDDFAHGLGAWKTDQPGVWTIAHGLLRADLPDQRQVRSLLRTGDPGWRDYALDFDVCMIRGVDKGAVVRLVDDVGVGVDLRGGSYQDVVAYVREWPMGKSPAVNSNATWNHVRIEVQGDRLRVRVNGDLALNRPQTRVSHGGIALAAYTGGAGQCTVYYDNVVVTAL